MDRSPEYMPPAGRCNRRPAKGARYRPRNPEPLDPVELTRRLYVVLAERKARAQGQWLARDETGRRRPHSPPVPEGPVAVGPTPTPPLLPTQTRRTSDPSCGGEQTHGTLHHPSSSSPTSTGSSHKDGEQALSSGYRHVPQVAASQFARTTTVDSPADRQLVHKLSRQAMRFHMEGPNASRDMAAANPGAAPFEQAQALGRARSTRERQYERNQFQHPPALATMVEADEQQPRRPNRHTFEPYFTPKVGGHELQAGPRRRSAGSIFGRADMAPAPSFEAPPGLVPAEGRESGDVVPSEHHPVDWTQSDEAMARPATPPRPLRRPESKWTLKGRFGGLVRHSRHESEKPPPFPPEEARELQESFKSLRCGGFFSRFRR